MSFVSNPSNRFLAAFGFTYLFSSLTVSLLILSWQAITSGVTAEFVFGMAGASLVLAVAFGIPMRRLLKQARGPAPDADAEASEDAAPDAASDDAPWMVRPMWRTPTQSSDVSLKTKFVVNGFIFLTVGLIALVDALTLVIAHGYSLWSDSFLACLLVAPVGMGLLLAGAWPVARACRFGRTTLELVTHPARLGRRLEAVFHTSMTPEQAPDDGFEVSLACCRRYLVTTTDSDGDTQTKVKKSVRWRDQKMVRPRRAPDGTLDLPVAFDVPADQPEATPEPRSERMMWELSVRGDVPGIDYAASFEIPVFAPDDDDEAGADARAAEASEPEHAWSLGASEGDASESDGSVDGALAAADRASGSDVYDDHVARFGYDAPTTERITMRRLSDGGVRFQFGPGGFLAATIFMGAMGAILTLAAGAAVLLGSLKGILLGPFLGLFALAAIIAAVTNQSRSTEVAVKDGRIVARTHLPWSTEVHTLDADELANVRVKAAGSAGGKAAYQILLVPFDPSEIASMEAKQRALRQRDALLGALETVGVTATETEDSRTFEQMTNTIAVAHHLWDRQEAEWIAAEILAAAERQTVFAPAPSDADRRRRPRTAG